MSYDNDQKCPYFAAAEKILAEAERLLEPHPISIAIFGSFTSQSLHEESDIDLLIISNALPGRPYERAQWIRPLQETWKDLRQKSFLDFPKRLSPLLISPDGFKESIGLRLSLANTAWILKDNGFLSSSLNEAREWILAGTWRRQPLKHGGWVWIPSKGVA